MNIMILVDYFIIYVKIIYFVGVMRVYVFFGEENGCLIMFDYKRKWMKICFLIILILVININCVYI